MTETLEQIETDENLQEEHKTRQLPTGIGAVDLKKDRETLPAVAVDNEVSWVNNKMNLPFNLRVGEQTRLGMFLTPNPQEEEGIYNLEVSGSHTRSGTLGRVIFSDREGRLYRDIDLKGTGYIKWSGPDEEEIRVGEIRKSWNENITGRSRFSTFKGTTGIANQELIRRDLDFSEKFLKAGIRTHRVVAIIDLKEVIDERGEKVSIEEAKKRGILSEEDEPVIEVRAYGVKTRLHDITRLLRDSSLASPEGQKNRAKGLKLLEDAKNIVAQEFNFNTKEFTYADYLLWLAKTIATNLARMRHNKWVSGYLTSHNITADGRIIDLDSVEKFKDKPDQESKKTYETDFDDAWDSFSVLAFELKNLNLIDQESGVYMQFTKDYEAELERLSKTKSLSQ